MSRWERSKEVISLMIMMKNNIKEIKVKKTIVQQKNILLSSATFRDGVNRKPLFFFFAPSPTLRVADIAINEHDLSIRDRILYADFQVNILIIEARICEMYSYVLLIS